jgi:hypothetical protein
MTASNEKEAILRIYAHKKAPDINQGLFSLQKP